MWRLFGKFMAYTALLYQIKMVKKQASRSLQPILFCYMYLLGKGQQNGPSSLMHTGF